MDKVILCSWCENPLTEKDFNQKQCGCCLKEITMTPNEVELLKLAIQIIDDNQEIGAKLSGTLLLAYLGYKKRMEAQDIDIICDMMCETQGEEFYPVMPKEFKQIGIDGCRSSVDAIQFMNHEGLKVEFMYSDEIGQDIGEIPCTEVMPLLLAKNKYALQDKSEETATKHFLDLKYLFANNKSIPALNSITLRTNFEEIITKWLKSGSENVTTLASSLERETRSVFGSNF